MSETIDPLRALYDALAEGKSSGPVAVRDMTEVNRRAYMREAKRRSRQRSKEAFEAGSPLPNDEAIRAALADAAIMILATNSPGAKEVLTVLGKAFPGRSGVPGTTQARAKAGTLLPTILTPERVSAAVTR